MTKQNKNLKKGYQKLAILISTILVVIVGVIFINKDSILKQDAGVDNTKTNADIKQNDNGDIVIPISEVTSTASFYNVTIDETDIEVLAIKAPDGTVRTAFNTCQVCFDSGRGYYKQSGDRLICQNCGNQFTASDVEVAKGGCNPIPISGKDKQVDADNITISMEYLTRAKEVFANWKTK